MGMDSKKIQEELQFLLEEDNRVITYKFVSANFGIHVNEAKRHLQSLWSACRGKGDDDVTATYFVSGLCDEDGDYVSQKALVVSEDQLAAVRGSLTSVTSEHVYSLQRHRVCDTAVLYGADLQERQADPVAFNSHGAIINPRAERIPEAELLKLRQAAVTPAVTSHPPKRPAAPAPAAVKKEPAAAAGQKPSETSPGNQKSKVAERDGASSGETAKAPAAAKGGATIASMFAKAATDRKTKSPTKKAAGGGMMASFLQKGAERKPATTVGDTNSAAPAAAASKKIESPAAKVEPEPETTAAPVRFGAKKGSGGGGGKGAGGKGAGAGRKRPRKTESGGPVKQRRRIQVLASDSSDSSDNDGDREEEPEPEPEPAPLCPPVDSDEEEKPAPQPRRKRKLVSKTFTDDDGFLVTKKEYESCSGSESEEPPAKAGPAAAEKSAPAPAPTEPVKPKEAAPHKVKQAGIMSFFKKK